MADGYPSQQWEEILGEKIKLILTMTVKPKIDILGCTNKAKILYKCCRNGINISLAVLERNSNFNQRFYVQSWL